jgi:ElaB/YqjD/DUF883 family membrane-anchored ribosome-binding protein
MNKGALQLKQEDYEEYEKKDMVMLTKEFNLKDCISNFESYFQEKVNSLEGELSNQREEFESRLSNQRKEFEEFKNQSVIHIVYENWKQSRNKDNELNQDEKVEMKSIIKDLIKIINNKMTRNQFKEKYYTSRFDSIFGVIYFSPLNFKNDDKLTVDAFGDHVINELLKKVKSLIDFYLEN